MNDIQVTFAVIVAIVAPLFWRGRETKPQFERTAPPPPPRDTAVP